MPYWGVLSDIHWVCINPEDPMDVRNDTQQDSRPQAVSFSNFLMSIWGVISICFEKPLPVISNICCR